MSLTPQNLNTKIIYLFNTLNSHTKPKKWYRQRYMVYLHQKLCPFFFIFLCFVKYIIFYITKHTTFMNANWCELYKIFLLLLWKNVKKKFKMSAGGHFMTLQVLFLIFEF